MKIKDQLGWMPSKCLIIVILLFVALISGCDTVKKKNLDENVNIIHAPPYKKVGMYQPEKLPSGRLKVEKAILVTGKIAKSGTDGALMTSYVLDKKEIVNESFPGRFSVILETNSGVFYIYTFDSTFQEAGYGGIISDLDEVTFTALMPYTDDVTKIILKEKEILNEMIVTPNIPSLSLIYPTGAEIITNNLVVKYDASDADGDDIKFGILISDDGGETFTSMKTDHTDKTYILDVSKYRGSDQYKIKVLATDGVNTNSVESGTFTIKKSRPPYLKIGIYLILLLIIFLLYKKYHRKK